MKVLVLGGCGIQGKAILYDLSRNHEVTEVVCADAFPENLSPFEKFLDMAKIELVRLDARDKGAMFSLMKQEIDVVIDVLPVEFVRTVAESAIESGVNLVNTNYGYEIRPFHLRAVERGIAMMPECGLDPGIDLVIYGHAVKQFDEIHVLNSYCGGIPEKKACTNPLNYKISWNWDMVLRSQKRETVAIKDGKRVVISGADQHDNELIHEIDFPGLGRLEAIPNGNAVFFTDLLGVTQTIKETGRYSLRWPGWCEFWRPLKKFQFLSDQPVAGLPCEITPHQFLVKLLEPQLQYGEDEKDLAVMQNIFVGLKDGKKKRIVVNLLLERDLKTGLMAMSLGVGYAASIVACMIAKGEIEEKGVLSPATHIPCDSFMKQLSERGIALEERVET
jgi:saccharopine dehydrogenase-like NADP-dependent oxidoreductase